MLVILDIAWKIVACILIADFLSGFFHWLEDTFWSPDTPIIGRWVIQPNIMHHHHPRDFVRNSWLLSADVPLILGGLILLGAWALGCFNWMVVLTMVVAVNANEIHKWAHRTRTENGRVIVMLQRLRIVQSPAHHARHHRDGKNTHYCVVTNLVNPALDFIHFWRILEFLLCRVIGLTKRDDDSVPAAKPIASSFPEN